MSEPLNPAQNTVRAFDAIGDVEIITADEGFFDLSQDQFQIFGVNIALKILEASAKGSRSQTVDNFETRGPADSVRDKVPLPGPHLPRRQGYPQPAFALPQRIFCALALHKLP